MVDYTTKQSGGSAVGLYIAAGAVVLILLWAIFAGSGGTPTIDPGAVGTAEPETMQEVAPNTLGGAETGTAPVITE